MSLLDIVEAVGEGTHKELIPGMTGSFNVTIGDAVAGFYGSRHTHIFGGEIKLVCDPEDLLMGKIAHYLPLTSALLAGIGGNATFVYAQNTTMIYGGPKFDVRRAPSISKSSDFGKLTALGSEGRSTATSILSLSAVRHLRASNLDDRAKKILSFTDNRQDASLQAGHFNDFVMVTQLRGALYRAMVAAGDKGLRWKRLGEEVVAAMGLSPHE